MTICLSVTSLVFVLRTYVRIFIKREWILEDYLCCISWTGLVVFCSLLITLMHKHGGVHMWDVTLMQMHTLSYLFMVERITYGLTIMFTKLSILLLYSRVFLPQRWSAFNIAIRLLMLIICLFYISTTAAKIWECTPRPRIWNKSIVGTCINVSSLLNTSGLFNTISDVLILLVPIKSVWNLNMDRGRKVACVLLFTVGLIAPVFSIIGLITRLRVSANPDISYNQPYILFWSAAEISTGIICVCLPTLAALGRRRRRRRRPSTSIVNGKSYPRSNRFLGSIQPTSFNEKDTLRTHYSEVPEDGLRCSDLVSQYAVITAIRGGATSPSAAMEGVRGDHGRRTLGVTFSPASGGEIDNESAIPAGGGGGIMKTFRIEQSSEVQNHDV